MDQGGFPNHFCDKGIDAQIRAALDDEESVDPQTRARANEQWAIIDREIVDAAPAVMPFNPADVNFLSKRVGNFQHQPVLDILLDQLWVQ